MAANAAALLLLRKNRTLLIAMLGRIFNTNLLTSCDCHDFFLVKTPFLRVYTKKSVVIID